ncbi:hypothetical protein ACU686_10195 [Yinghuangia aomiensis]
MSRRTTAAAALTAGVLVLSACGGGASGNDAGSSGDALVLGSPVPVPTLDPAGIQEGMNLVFEQALYDSVLKLSATGEVEPNLATSWEYDPTRTHLTLKLRPGVLFTDGTPWTPRRLPEASSTSSRAGPPARN